jgi:hypothetical protein
MNEQKFNRLDVMVLWITAGALFVVIVTTAALIRQNYDLEQRITVLEQRKDR